MVEREADSIIAKVVQDLNHLLEAVIREPTGDVAVTEHLYPSPFNRRTIRR